MPPDDAGGPNAKVAVITGVSDQGIGGAIAERFAADGMRLALLVKSGCPRLEKRLNRREVPHLVVPVDVTSHQSVQQAIERVHDELGALDVLINNAGVELARPVAQFADAQWQEIIDVNLNGAIRVTRAALPYLRSPSAIVNISSALALGGCPGFSIYSASKAGLDGLTQSLAWELAPRKIRVVSVAPGLVLTPMIRKHIDQLTTEMWNQINACHPLGVGRPSDVADVVSFLASDDARWITGITLPVGWASHFPLPVAQWMQTE